ncbi:mitochondrial import receptor subunit TOM40 homolog 1 [Lingula anatina]|uniref:Mitochondrial import receptor subunit TOM40 homolog 1 n=1 Tax=Lingula anatina TaxID=7574 RepID=A0A1S3HRG3_LINAN|nr:mitochondrial import receptor subunit TOM40 homolog 1 [Lingula anatina]|eukprot:XP_013387639.1 mitochondrial import receptor subunit TOM40 homolog 1 [Lingula anatina]
MGTVHAVEANPQKAGASVGYIPAPSMVQPPVAGQPPPAQQEPPPQKEDDGPGTFEDLHKACKDMFPTPFDGAKIMINKGLSNHFQVSHTFTMSNVSPAGYRFGCTYVGTNQPSPTEAYPVLLGELSPSGDMNANIIHQVTQNLRTKFVAQIQGGKWVATQFQNDYKGKDYTASFAAMNPNFLNDSGIYVGQYLQNVTKSLALGAEVFYQRDKQLPGHQIAVLTLAGKYTGTNCQAGCNLTPGAGGLHLSYHHKLDKQVQMGVELETSLRMRESVATFGYQVDSEDGSTTFKAQADTNWCVGATLEKKLLPMPFSLILSGFANHPKSSYRFGIGFMVG